MKKLLTLAIIASLLTVSCTDELPEPERLQEGKDNYDRVEKEKVRRIG